MREMHEFREGERRLFLPLSLCLESNRRNWDAPSSSWVSVTTPSTSDVPLRTATAFLVASATTSALAAPPEPATRRSEWKGRAEDDGVAKRAAGGAAAASRKVCAAMAAGEEGGCWLRLSDDDKVGWWARSALSIH